MNRKLNHKEEKRYVAFLQEVKQATEAEYTTCRLAFEEHGELCEGHRKITNDEVLFAIYKSIMKQADPKSSLLDIAFAPRNLNRYLRNNLTEFAFLMVIRKTTDDACNFKIAWLEENFPISNHTSLFEYKNIVYLITCKEKHVPLY
jgi:hypothetical protein